MTYRQTTPTLPSWHAPSTAPRLKLETWIEGSVALTTSPPPTNSSPKMTSPAMRYIFSGFPVALFTVRSLAGLITACGILFRPSLGALPDAWIYYRSPKPHSPAFFATKYGVQSHLDPSITPLGVWDTVGSLVIPGSPLAASNKEKFAFHDTNPSPLVKCAKCWRSTNTAVILRRRLNWRRSIERLYRTSMVCRGSRRCRRWLQDASPS